MQQRINKFLTYRLLFLILMILAFGVRIWRSPFIPFQSDGDELAFVFAGQSLIEGEGPISWSSFSPGNREIVISEELGDPSFNANDTFTLLKPWFDHPPLLPLIIGYWTRINGYSFPSIPPSVVLHIPMIVFSMITLWLVYEISKYYFNYKGGLFSLIVFGFSPSIVMIHRMVVGENIVVLLWLACWYWLIKKKSITIPVLLIVLSGLTKITGLAGILIFFGYLWNEKRNWSAIYFSIASLLIFTFIYGSYGYLYGWDLFIDSLKNQSFRLIGWSNPAFIFSSPGFHIRTILDFSYYIILLFGFAPLLTSINLNHNHKFITWALVWSLILVWITSAEQDMLGWYKLPFFTFLGISLGAIAKNKINTLVLVLIMISAINNIGIARDLLHPLPSQLLLRMTVNCLIGTMLFAYILETRISKCLSELLKSSLIIATLTMYIFSCIYSTNGYYASICTHNKCPVPTLSLFDYIILGR